MKIYANALLKNNEIMFWKVGPSVKTKYDYYKDFYYVGLKQDVDKPEYSHVSALMKNEGNAAFEEAKEWYKQWKISKDSKGQPPY